MDTQHRVGEEWVPRRERARDCGPVNFACMGLGHLSEHCISIVCVCVCVCV